MCSALVTDIHAHTAKEECVSLSRMQRCFPLTQFWIFFPKYLFSKLLLTKHSSVISAVRAFRAKNQGALVFVPLFVSHCPPSDWEMFHRKPPQGSPGTTSVASHHLSPERAFIHCYVLTKKAAEQDIRAVLETELSSD